MAAPSAAAALLALVTLASLAAFSSAAVFGGATSVSSLEPVVIGAYSGRRFVGAYSAVGSGAGIAGFSASKIAIAASDDPMTVAQDRGSLSKFTFPQVLTTYSFINGRSSRIRLSPAQIWGIYNGRISTWNQIRGSGLTGAIIPVVRAEASGTTELVTKWLQRNRAGIPSSQVNLGPWSPGSRRLVRQKGSAALAAYVKAHPTAIGYVQTGIGTKYKNYEIAIRNPAGAYVKATGSNVVQVVPRSLPSPAATWSGVTLLNSPGKATYPIASFVYLFVRRTYGRSSPPVKAFLTYLLSNAAQNIGPRYFFTPLPTAVRNVGLTAIRAIK